MASTSSSRLDAATIAAILAGKPVRPQGGNFLVRCPVHDDRNPSLSIRDGDDGRLLVHCHAGCDPRDVLAAIRDRTGGDLGPTRSVSPRPGRKAGDGSGRARKIEGVGLIWRASVDPGRALAETYLNGRGLDLPDDLRGRVLRFHPACPWGTGRVPALIAAFHPIIEPDDDAPPVAIMRIGLDADGRKIDRKALGPVSGCAIKLDPDEAVGHGLGIAEGLETALAVRATGWRPIWALGSAGAIAKFPPLAGVETLTIFADHDSAGLTAAQVCAERWQAAGAEAFVRWPKGLGRDYADDRS